MIATKTPAGVGAPSVTFTFTTWPSASSVLGVDHCAVGHRPGWWSSSEACVVVVVGACVVVVVGACVVVVVEPGAVVVVDAGVVVVVGALVVVVVGALVVVVVAVWPT